MAIVPITVNFGRVISIKWKCNTGEYGMLGITEYQQLYARPPYTYQVDITLCREDAETGQAGEEALVLYAIHDEQLDDLLVAIGHSRSAVDYYDGALVIGVFESSLGVTIGRSE